MRKGVGMVALLAALLSQGLGGSANYASMMHSRGGPRKFRKHQLSDTAEKQRKAKKRAENKARSVHARVRRAND